MQKTLLLSASCALLIGCCSDFAGRQTHTTVSTESFDFAQSPYALGDVDRDGSRLAREAVIYSSDKPTTTALMLRASDESQSSIEVFFETVEGDQVASKSAGMVRPGMSFAHAEANVKRIILRIPGEGKGPAKGRMIVF